MLQVISHAFSVTLILRVVVLNQGEDLHAEVLQEVAVVEVVVGEVVRPE